MTRPTRPPRIHRDPSLGDVTAARTACSVCFLFAYHEGEPPERAALLAESAVKKACPRKPKCKPWADRGCKITTLRPEPPTA